jgi:DNA polymerase-3 subunit epsilon
MQLNKNLNNGNEILTFLDGKKYIGMLTDGIPNGNGILTFPDGKKYIGEFKDGKFNGNGIYNLNNGEKYVGEFKDDKYFGKGTLKFDNAYGDDFEYIGEFKDGKYNGNGRLSKIYESYEGEFKDGEYHGNGMLECWDDQFRYHEKYIGEFKDGKKCNGNGVLEEYFKLKGYISIEFNDWNCIFKKYIGEFKNDLKNGIGTLTTEDYTYIGEFKNDKFNGIGTKNFHYKESFLEYYRDIKNFKEGYSYYYLNKYIGVFEDGSFKKGSLDFNFGLNFEGEFNQFNQCHGLGTLTFINGDKYIGEFRYNNFIGTGTIKLKNGEKHFGEFKGNLEDIHGTFMFPKGGKYIGEFNDGVFINKKNENSYVKLIENKIENLGSEISNFKKVNTNLKSYNYLFFDTETTGLPKNWKAPITDFNNWPRLVQLAYLVYDFNGYKISEGNFIISPNGFRIPDESSNIHGITNERAIREGQHLFDVLERFNILIENATFLVAHNMSFDEKIIGSEFLRSRIENSLNSINKICTMESTTKYCKIDGPNGYKWPKLSELHLFLFGTDFEEAHNAYNDIKATAKCFWELKKRNLL